jgi:hypothetical protein
MEGERVSSELEEQRMGRKNISEQQVVSTSVRLGRGPDLYIIVQSPPIRTVIAPLESIN